MLVKEELLVGEAGAGRSRSGAAVSIAGFLELRIEHET
jgi:hypothetical protein